MPPQQKPARRIAVLMIHGQGDQTPMTGVTELAHSVWETDERAIPPDADPKAPPLGKVWSVPVDDGDMEDQRRIATGFDTKGETRVDFYELYWAHLMPGNRLLHVWQWLIELLRKGGGETPNALKPARAALMSIAFATCLAAIGLAATTVARFAPAVLYDARTLLLLAIAASGAYVLCVLSSKRLRLQGLYAALLAIGLSVIAGAAWTAPRFDGALAQGALALWPDAAGFRAAPLAFTLTFPAASEPLLSAIVVAHAVFYYGAVGVFAFVALAAIAIGGFLINTMADSARYFRATPDNIDARRAIRKAGVDMLRHIHDSPKAYDRVIIVAHSLGSVIGYGVLSQYWGLVRDKVSKPGLHAPLAAVEAAAAPLWQAWSTYWSARVAFKYAKTGAARRAARRPLREAEKALRDAVYTDDGAFDAARAAYAKALAQPSVGADGARALSAWRVSDFITLGSPLTYAPFFLSRNEKDFWDETYRMRRYSSAPPVMETLDNDGDGRPSLRFSYLTKGPDGEVWSPHHSAVFGAVRWTALHARTALVFKGDLVSGPLGGVFGPAVIDVSLPLAMSAPDKKTSPQKLPPPRTFMHNAYWKWPAPRSQMRLSPRKRDAVDAHTRQDEMPDSVLALRCAMALFDDPDAPAVMSSLRKLRASIRPD
ncbi:MAG: hypothetical protein NW203_00320 [Hyphomonadaceae bacterium]|nr:hypothetical protein [Hyphomonadaceae bacterium]